MVKGPRDPKEILGELTADYKGIFKRDLVSILLYGSAAGKGYRPGKSDINVMIILSEEGIDRLDEALPLVDTWRKRKVAVPLFLTEAYILSSTDVFPIEYLTFQRNHVLVYGKDVLADLTFDRECMRLQCERELKGKLVLLREGFLETSGRSGDLRDLIARSIQAFSVVCEALLFLKDEQVPAGDRRQALQRACGAYGVNAGVFLKMLDIREEIIKPGGKDLHAHVKDYLREAGKLANAVDALGGVDG